MTRLLGSQHTYPWGITAHKQGRIAGLNAVGGHATFADSLSTRVIKVFDLVSAASATRT